MPSGGRRQRKKDSALGPARARVPSAPKDLPEAEQLAWVEVKRQVDLLGTYTKADYSAFRLAVRALTLAYEAGPDVKATSRRALLESASGLIGRFGCDPIARLQVDAAPEPKSEVFDPADEFKDIE
jgi:hypothetical protein